MCAKSKAQVCGGTAALIRNRCQLAAKPGCSNNPATCQQLQFSYGVHPVLVEHDHADWTPHLRDWMHQQGITGGLAVLAQGPSEEYPCGNHRMEIVDLAR